MNHRFPALLRLAPVLLALTLVFASCSVRQEMSLDGDGAGEASITVELHRVLLDYLADLSGFSGGTIEVFDLAALRQRFADEPGLTLVAATTPRPNRLELQLRYDDIGRVFDAQQDAVREVFAFERNGAERRLAIKLTPDAVRELLAFSPASDTMLADILLPPADQPMKEADYVDYLAWALEEYQQETPIPRIIRDASIEVSIRPAGSIVGQTGGRVQGNRVVYDIRVVQLLTMQEPLEYSLTFR